MKIFQSIINDPHSFLYIRTVLGLILIIAGILKLSNRKRFIEVVRSYDLLPVRATVFVGRSLPVIELTVGGALLAGILLLWSALAATGLFLLFASVITINLLRGRDEIACGCFGIRQEDRLTWRIVIRNTIFAILAACVGISQFDFIQSASSLQHWKIVPVSTDEAVLTFLVAAATILLWWLSSALFMLLRLPNPGSSCGGCSKSIGLPEIKG